MGTPADKASVQADVDPALAEWLTDISKRADFRSRGGFIGHVLQSLQVAHQGGRFARMDADREGKPPAPKHIWKLIQVRPPPPARGERLIRDVMWLLTDPDFIRTDAPVDWPSVMHETELEARKDTVGHPLSGPVWRDPFGMWIGETAIARRARLDVFTCFRERWEEEQAVSQGRAKEVDRAHPLDDARCHVDEAIRFIAMDQKIAEAPYTDPADQQAYKEAVAATQRTLWYVYAALKVLTEVPDLMLDEPRQGEQVDYLNWNATAWERGQTAGPLLAPAWLGQPPFIANQDGLDDYRKHV